LQIGICAQMRVFCVVKILSTLTRRDAIVVEIRFSSANAMKTQPGNHNLRRQILARRDQLSSRQRKKLSARIMDLLLSVPEVREAATVFVYVNFRSEVETLPFITHLLRGEKVITVPRTDCANKALQVIRLTDPDKELSTGYCGIPEPDPSLVVQHRFDPALLDVVITPGSVFDRRGGRRGYGGGYYDRFLVHDAPQAFRVALAYDLQVVDRLHLQSHDQFMDMIVTQTGIQRFARENPHAHNSHLSPSPVSGP
jgi:5-formyltetrahydrofolate cyclo-ligase